MSPRTETKNTAGPRGRRRRGRRRPVARRAAPTIAVGGGDALALQAELVLLREENARLKTAGDREPDLGTLLTRARRLPGARVGAEDRADEAAQLLAEGMVLRESLLGLCQEIARAMGALEARLTALGGPADAAPEGRGAHDHLLP